MIRYRIIMAPCQALMQNFYVYFHLSPLPYQADNNPSWDSQSPSPCQAGSTHHRLVRWQHAPSPCRAASCAAMQHFDATLRCIAAFWRRNAAFMALPRRVMCRNAAFWRWNANLSIKSMGYGGMIKLQTGSREGPAAQQILTESLSIEIRSAILTILL